MIKIDVEGYCQECLDFTPDVVGATRVFYADGDGDNEIVQTDTLVRCKYRKRCAGIKRYLEQQMKGDVSG